MNFEKIFFKIFLLFFNELIYYKFILHEKKKNNYFFAAFLSKNIQYIFLQKIEKKMR